MAASTTVAERARWLERFQKSGLSRSEFARQHGIKVTTFYNWFRQPPVRPSGSLRQRPVFQEVSLGQALGQKWAAEITRPDGSTLRLSAEAPPYLVQALLRGLPC